MVQRPLKFVKYLPEFGWLPTVISTNVPFNDQGWDAGLVAEIPPSVTVHRPPTPQPKPVDCLAGAVGWRGNRRDGKVLGPPQDSAIAAPAVRQSPAVKLRRALLAPGYLVQNPPVDGAIYWALSVIPLARRLIERDRIDAILTTSAPWSSLIVGAVLQRLTGIPWLADFRDPWTEDSAVYQGAGWRRHVDRRLERHLPARARAITTTTGSLAQGIRGWLGSDTSGREVHVVTNGWDPEDFRAEATPQHAIPDNPRPICVVHMGSVYDGALTPLLRALSDLQADGHDLSGLSLQFTGYMSPATQAEVVGSSIGSLCTIQTERVSHAKALEMMRSAHLLLIALRSDQTQLVPGKTYEYMAIKRPVLALVPAAAREVIAATGIGCGLDPSDQPAIRSALRQILVDYARFVREHFQPDSEAINGFSRVALAGKLATILDGIVQGAAPHVSSTQGSA